MDPGQLIININTNINTRLKFIINTNINAQAQYSRIPGPIHRFILFCTKVIGHTKTKRSQITKVIEQKQTFLLSQSNTTQADPQMKSTNWDVPKNTFFNLYSTFQPLPTFLNSGALGAARQCLLRKEPSLARSLFCHFCFCWTSLILFSLFAVWIPSTFPFLLHLLYDIYDA